MLCSKTLSLNTATADNPMDAAIYRPASTSIFAVRAGYVFEFSLGGTQLRSAKFTNPCFSKSCMAYDSVHDQLWIGTGGDWAMGRSGDAGITAPTLSTSGFYRVDPVTLLLQQFVDPSAINWTGLSVTSPGDSGAIFMYGGNTGIYDILYGNGNIYAALYGNANHFVNTAQGFLVGFSPTNPSGANNRFTCPDLPISQITYESSNSPNRIWGGPQDCDLWTNDPPVAMSVDGSTGFNFNFNPFTSPSLGAHGAIAYCPVNGKVYMVNLSNQSLAKYNVDGTLNGNTTLAGATLGGMTAKIRYNPNDQKLYIPCPNANQVIQYDPPTDTVTHIFTVGLDAPHDMVFSPAAQYAIQAGPTGIIALTT